MHTICALQEVFRHHTSEGLVSYHRCRCGRLNVRRGDVAVLSSGRTSNGLPSSSHAQGVAVPLPDELLQPPIRPMTARPALALPLPERAELYSFEPEWDGFLN